MSVHNPSASSFSRYAQENLGPLAGFITGWTYCFEILIVAIADVTAFGIYMGVWFPAVPHWIWVLSVVLIICAVNLMSVKVFGELEFWFSFFKVATIIIMILAGFGIIIWGIGNGGQPTGIHNLWSNGGFFSNGWLGMVMSLQMVMFAYGGIEIIGITAGEAKRSGEVYSARHQLGADAYHGVLRGHAVCDYVHLPVERWAPTAARLS